MGTQIRAIIQAVADVPIIVGSGDDAYTPAVRVLDDLPDVLHDAELPLRMVHLSGTGEDGFTPHLTFGKNGRAEAEWEITDRFIWKSAAQDRGLSVAIPALTDYLIAYVDTMQQRSSLLTGGSAILERIVVTFGRWVYPSGGNASYHSAEATLIIREHIT